MAGNANLVIIGLIKIKDSLEINGRLPIEIGIMIDRIEDENNSNFLHRLVC